MVIMYVAVSFHKLFSFQFYIPGSYHRGKIASNTEATPYAYVSKIL